MHLECDRSSKGFMMSSFTAPPFAVPATVAQRGSRRQVLTALIAAAPVVLTVAVFIHPNDTDDAAETLARIAGADRARWITAHLLESFALLTMAVVLTLVGWAATGSGRNLTRVGGTLAAIGAASTALIVYAHGEAYRFMTQDESTLASMERLYDRFHDGMPMVGPLAMLFMVGMVVLGAGLFRTKLAPVWAAIAIALTPVLMFLVGGSVSAQVAALVGGVPMIVGLAGSAKPVATAWSGPR